MYYSIKYGLYNNVASDLNDLHLTSSIWCRYHARCKSTCFVFHRYFVFRSDFEAFGLLIINSKYESYKIGIWIGNTMYFSFTDM